MQINHNEPTQEQIIDYLKSKGLETKVSNGQIVTNYCPFCPDKKLDWTHFYIDPKGIYYCHKCATRGNTITLTKHFGDYIPSVPKKPSNNAIDLGSQIKNPEQVKKEKPKVLPDPEEKLLKSMAENANIYHKALLDGFNAKPNTLVKQVADYLTKERGFDIDTLKHFKIGWTGQAISVPYFDDGKVVNIRFRKNPFDNNDRIPKMINTVNAKMTLFNVDVLKNTEKVVVCLTKNQKVLSKDGFKKVSSLLKTDEVLTHKGHYSPINTLLKRKYKGSLITIKPKYYPESLEITEEHPVYCCEVSKCSFSSWKLHCSPKCKRKYKYKTLKCQEFFTPIWKEAKYVTGKEFLVYPINRKEIVNAKVKVLPSTLYNNKQFWYFVGLFLGDGTINRNNKYKSGITICGDANSKLFIKDFVSKYVRSLGGTGKESVYNNAWRITLSNASLARFFFSNFYNKKKEKVVPYWVEYLPKDFQIEIIKGLFHTDGCLHKNKNGNDIRITNTSLDLLSSMQRILLRFNILVSIEKGRKAGNAIFRGKEHKSKQLYNLRGGCDLAKLLKEKIINRVRSNPQYFIVGDNVFYPIAKVLRKKNTSCDVYNLNVKKEHSFSSGLIITHNCEGEFDAMSLYQQGWQDVVSISVGAKTFKDEWVELLKRQRKIYIAYDNDAPGQEGVDIAVEKLGAGRCYIIKLPKEPNEKKKDINDFFAKDKKSIDDFHKLFNNAERKEINYEHIKHIKEIGEITKEEILSAGTLRGLSTGYPLLDKLWSGMRKGDLIVLSGDTNQGKCHAKGTKILMFDGELKKVEDIKIGDKLMGVDSTPRKVLRLARGRETMYKILPMRGAEEFIVNKNHILSLKKNTKKYSHYPEYLNITVDSYLKMAKKRKHVYKLWKPNKIEFKEKSLLLEPYFLGVWLGDGTSINPCITSMDKEIVDYLKGYAKKLGLQLTKKIQLNNKSSYYCLTREKRFSPVSKRNKKGYGNITSLKEILLRLNVIGNKHIPKEYIINSEKNRLELLAGLIDSGGSKEGAGYSFYNKNKQLCKDVIFLARSLGFFASTLKKKKTTCNGKKYTSYSVYISGDIKRIPIKVKRKIADERKNHKNWLTTGFRIKKLKKDNYYGFTLNKDQLYLLDSFIVNHNTFMAQNIILNLAKQGVKSMLFSLEQTADEIVERFLLLNNQFDFRARKEVDKDKAIAELNLVISNLQGLPIYMYASNDYLNLKSLGEISERAVKDFGCEIVIIDHLHYFASGDRRQRTQEIGDITRYTKLLARKLNIPIILICHLRKLQGENITPTLDDLKDSSGIKQDADIVALIARNRDKHTRQLDEVTRINTDKNRHGRVGQVEFSFGKEEGKDLCVFTELNSVSDDELRKEGVKKDQDNAFQFKQQNNASFSDIEEDNINLPK